MSPTLPSHVADLTQRGIAALRSGNTALAYDLLQQATTRDPGNVHGWLWLSGAASNVAERRVCLERVLAIDPANAAAQRGLAQLSATPAPQTPTSASAAPTTFHELPCVISPPPGSGESNLPASTATIPQSPAVTPLVATAPAATPRARSVAPRKPRRGLAWLGIALGTIIVFGFGCIVLVGALSLLGRRAETAILPVGQPPAGWQKFTGGGASLWLPASYVGGDISLNKAAVARQIRAQGPNFAGIAQTIEQNDAGSVIWVIEPASSSSGFLTNANVGKDFVSASMKIDDYLNATLKQSGNRYRLINLQIMPRGTEQIGRMMLQSTDVGASARLVMYVIKNGRTCWIVTFAAGTDDFSRQLAVFEQSMRTFAAAP